VDEAPVDLRAGDAALDEPAAGASWPESRSVGAEVIVALLLGAGSLPVRASDIRLTGARITGRLDLSWAGPPRRGGATLAAGGVVAERGLICQEGFTARGEARLHDARIARELNMSGAVLP
jgi:hypothetical protein